MENNRDRRHAAFRFLSWFCPEHLLEGIEGDLEEVYQANLHNNAGWVASLRMWWSVIQFFRPSIILRNRFKTIGNMMFKNYLTIALRNMSKNKGYSSINIVGLGLGMACSLVILLYVYGEWSYNKGFSKSDRIYRIGISFFNIGNFAAGPEELLNVLPKEFAGIENFTRIQNANNEPISVKGNTTYQTAYYTDSAFFDLFDYRFISGNPQSALNNLNSAVITTGLANTLFGKTDVVGDIIEVGKEKTPYAIQAVVESPSFNTHFKTDLWLSIDSKLTNSAVWTSASFHSYVLLKENVTESSLQEALNSVFENHVFPESGKMMGFKTLEDYRRNDISVKFYVHALQDIYLKSKLSYDLSPGGNEQNVYIFGAVALFVLLLASINFINLSTARASRRAKEVAVRKSLGTSRFNLVQQFLVESVLISVLSLGMALLLAEGFLWLYNQVTGKILLDTIWQSFTIVILFVAFALFIGLLSGIYPSLVLTSFKPIKVLKGDTAFSSGKFFRNGLVVFQFTISVLLIIGAIIIQDQIQFMKSKDLGFDQGNVLTLEKAGLLKQSIGTFKEEMSKEPGVVQSSLHTGEPGSNRVTLLTTYSVPGMEHPVSIATYRGDENFLEVNGMKLLMGRNFSDNLPADSLAVIVNEAAVKALGIAGNPIGMELNGGQPIVGVVSNFHFQSLRKNIEPLIILPQFYKNFYELSFKIQPQSLPDFITAISKKWKQFVPDEPIKYHFLDENFGEMIRQEAELENMILFFTSLAICISCLGLLGLSAYTAEQRTKEIGIRKVLGASSGSILYLLNRKFTMLVVVALFIAMPIAWYVMNFWLQGFAYRIRISPWALIVGGFLALTLAWLTTTYHAWRASSVNPTESLKYE